MKAIARISIDVFDSMPTFLQNTFLILTFTLLTAIAAQIKIPIPGTVVPMTLQTTIVLLTGLFLGANRGSLTQVFYILFGLLGLPFFATSMGLFGPTGGYLIGFILAAYFCGFFRGKTASLVRSWLVAFLASLIIFVCGMLYLKWFLNLSWHQAFFMGVVPFILGDLLKVTLAASLHRVLSR